MTFTYVIGGKGDFCTMECAEGKVKELEGKPYLLERYNSIAKANGELHVRVKELEAKVERAHKVLRSLNEAGEFYPSCIELDSYEYQIDGEKIQKEIKAILEVEG